MMENQETIIDGITKLISICSEANVIFSQRQATILANVFQFYSENNLVIGPMLNLMEKSLQFEQKENIKLFSSEQFLYIFFTYYTSKYTLNSLFHIVNADITSARLILNYLQDGTIISAKTLLKKTAYNLELNIHFLSAFTKYEEEEFTLFISQILNKIFKLSMKGIRGSSVRNACLIFLKDALCKNNSLVEEIAYSKYFAITFQSPPQSRSERILMLNLLNIVASLTKDAVTIIVEKNLLTFAVRSMKMASLSNLAENDQIQYDEDSENDFFDVAIAALDVMREIASCGKGATEILYEYSDGVDHGIVPEIWNFLNDQNQLNLITAAMLTLLEIIKYSTEENQNWMAQNGLFEVLAIIFDTLPNVFLEKAVYGLCEIIKIADEEANKILLEAILGSKNLIEKLTELSQDEDRKDINPVCLEILARTEM